MSRGKEGDDSGKKPRVLRYDGRRLSDAEHRLVEEFPLALTVNGIELATLIASPHELPYLVGGFLRMQGLVKCPDDFLALSVCPDFGVALVHIRGNVPERLKPTLTSGCGAGITFNLALPPPPQGNPAGDRPVFSPADIFAMMNELSRRAEGYKSHGGVHSAAVGDGRSVLLHAEDIGRHNTLDRIAGEALFKNIDLSGKILVTSGRVSSDMAAKAASLGIALVASRTSPTDMAVRICEESGITLVGYVRGGRFLVYAHPWRIAAAFEKEPIEGITCILLASGASSRMGSNKALLPYQGGRFIEVIHRQMATLFREVLIVTNTPELFDFLPSRKVPDLIPGMGPLSGIHSGLRHSETPHVFAVACDMPYLNPDLIRHLASLAEGFDVVIPETGKGLEPLHAIYGKNSLLPMEEALHAGKGRIVSFFDKVRIRKVTQEEVSRFDPAFQSFRNINTPEDYFRIRERLKPPGTVKPGKPQSGKDQA
ncbi:MAG TPA: formate dehydrogenase accessory sulfurtransferase FdhD [Candidatus Limnocylindrales bacterium]|nr:formate dehydrogenase accessory sulfurtransferase FdhD [Candidatus Limnocylindrales bacterium]